ncbi:unnamed protein product [Linum trigynum]|uniref:Glycolipid transfer protein domain-containing protein n=1 Tax=Linum trigynum TaxID=586398 RepID=A0AAV2GPV5_9ROSI
MKRKREMEKASELKYAVEEISLMTIIINPGHHHHDPNHDNDDGDEGHNCSDGHPATTIPTRPFLHVCNLVVQILDNIGLTMVVLRKDIIHNIQRLESQFDVDPSLYSNLIEILKKESNEGSSRKRNSCSKALLWLTRSLDFMCGLLQNLVKDLSKDMEQVVEECYSTSLKPWHGWISSAAFKVALKLVPNRKTFISLLKPKDETNDDILKEDTDSLLVPILQDIHAALVTCGSVYQKDKERIRASVISDVALNPISKGNPRSRKNLKSRQ